VCARARVCVGYLIHSVNNNTVLNLMSNDCQRLVDTFQWANLGLVAPITLIVVAGLLINLLKAYALIGIGVLVLMLPINGLIAKKFVTLRREILKFTDQRIQLENEMLQVTMCVGARAGVIKRSVDVGHARDQVLRVGELGAEGAPRCVLAGARERDRVCACRCATPCARRSSPS
jgi:hypothetical protein